MKRSRRELAQRIEEFTVDSTGNVVRPDSLTPEEKETLDSLFRTARPQAGVQTPVGKAIAALYRLKRNK